jgi:hypothetical protein
VVGRPRRRLTRSPAKRDLLLLLLLLLGMHASSRYTNPPTYIPRSDNLCNFLMGEISSTMHGSVRDLQLEILLVQ